MAKTGHSYSHPGVRLQKNMQKRVASNNFSSPWPRIRRQGSLRRSSSEPQLYPIWGNQLLSSLLFLLWQQLVTWTLLMLPQWVSGTESEKWGKCICQVMICIAIGNSTYFLISCNKNCIWTNWSISALVMPMLCILNLFRNQEYVDIWWGWMRELVQNIWSINPSIYWFLCQKGPRSFSIMN